MRMPIDVTGGFSGGMSFSSSHSSQPSASIHSIRTAFIFHFLDEVEYGTGRASDYLGYFTVAYVFFTVVSLYDE